MLRKSTNLIIDPVIISSTDIGAEICFDPVGLYIFFRFQTGLFRIIKGTGIFFQKSAVLFWKLTRISGSCLWILCKSSYQCSDQFPVCRHCILCHKYKDLRIRKLCRLPSGTAMVKFFFCKMPDFHKRIFLFPGLFPEFLFCIHNKDLIDRIFLCAESFQQFFKFFSRMVCRDDHVCF